MRRRIALLRQAVQNPIYVRLARSRPPLLRTSVAAAIVLAGIGIALTVYDAQHNTEFQPLPGVRVMALPYLPNPPGGWINPILYYFSGGASALAALPAWVVAVSVPPLTAIIAAHQTARDRAEVLLQVTPLDDLDMAWGHIYAALYRALPLIIVQVGMLPALIGGTWNDALYLLHMRMLGLWPNSQNLFRMARYDLTPLDRWGVLAILLMIGIGLVWANLLAAALGMTFGGSVRRAYAAALAAGLALVITLSGAALAWKLLVQVAWRGVAESGPFSLIGAAAMYAALVGAPIAIMARERKQADHK